MWIDGILEVVKILVVPLVIAWSAAKFGVRQGLQQARRERAFDRRLDWSEQTLRQFNEYLFSFRNLAATHTTPEKLNRDMFENARDGFLKSAKKVGDRITEATAYTDRKTLSKMRSFLEQSNETKHMAEGPRIGTVDLQVKEKAIHDITVKIMYELTVSIREQLGLDKITEEEFRWKEPS